MTKKDLIKAGIVGFVTPFVVLIFLTEILNFVLIPYNYKLFADSQELYNDNFTIMMNNIKDYYTQFDNVYNHNYTQFLGKNLTLLWFDLYESNNNVNTCVRFNAVDLKPSIMLMTKCGTCELYSRLLVGIMENLNYTAFEIIFPGEDHHSAGFIYEDKIVHIDPMYYIDMPLREREEEVNVTYAYGRFLNRTTFELTQEYTDVSNLTVFVKDELGNPLQGVHLSIISCALKDRCKTIPEINCDTNEEGSCQYTLGDALYNISANYAFRTTTIPYFLNPNSTETLTINI